MFILINKPKGITSHDVIYRLRKITGEKRIGHAGTLDPNATGLLILGIGRNSTKRLSEFLKLDKVYEAEFTLGEERDTDDVEGKVINSMSLSLADRPTKKQIESCLQIFIGKHIQIPPVYSAIKLQGKKAYQLARCGIDISLASRKVQIYSIKLLNYKYPILSLRTKVSSGTYIRSIARDFGRKINNFAYLSNLKRVQIGKYKIKDATKLDELTSENWKNYVFSIE